MAYKKYDELVYEYKQDGIDEVIDEAPGSNSFLGLREVRWSSDREFKLDLRRYICKADGSETIGKGISFTTKEGPSCLAETLVEHGYGSTGSILSDLSHREDFAVCLADTLHAAIEIDKNFKSKVEEAYKAAAEAKSAKDMLSEIL